MAGPKENLAKGWGLLRQDLKIEPETSLSLNLGCNQSNGSVVLGNGQKVRYCVDRYLEVAGSVELKKVATPGVHEETKDHPSRMTIQTGPSVVRNWCSNRVPTNGYDTPSCPRASRG